MTPNRNVKLATEYVNPESRDRFKNLCQVEDAVRKHVSGPVILTIWFSIVALSRWSCFR